MLVFHNYVVDVVFYWTTNRRIELNVNSILFGNIGLVNLVLPQTG